MIELCQLLISQKKEKGKGLMASELELKLLEGKEFFRGEEKKGDEKCQFNL